MVVTFPKESSSMLKNAEVLLIVALEIDVW